MIKKIVLGVRNFFMVFISGYRMRLFINSMEDYSKKELLKEHMILVQPLYIITWPLYMMALGYMLERKGLNVAFIWDKTNFENNYFHYKASVVVIKYCLSLLEKKGYRIYELSNFNSTSSNLASDEYLSNLAEMQSIWLAKGESSIKKRKIIHNRYFLKLNQASKKMNVIFQSMNCERLIVAGGLLSTANLYIKYCNYFNISISTVDCGEGISLISNSGVASQLSDIPIAFDLLEKESKGFVKKLAYEHLRKRMSGTDKFKYQSKKMDKKEDVKAEVLILLNSVWDQAALGLHTIYPSTNKWLTETVKWVLENTKLSIVVRQHPAEKDKNITTTDDYEDLLSEYSGNSRFTFVSAHNEQNTYSMIKRSKVVICYSTTTALEAVMLYKPVITVSSCYYSKQNFIFNPVTLDEYYELITKGVDGGLILPVEDVDSASAFYYLSQVCNWIFTDFNACGYEKWVFLNSEKILQLPGVEDMLKSLSDGIPYAIVKHKKLVKEYQQKSVLNNNEGDK